MMTATVTAQRPNLHRSARDRIPLGPIGWIACLLVFISGCHSLNRTTPEEVAESRRALNEQIQAALEPPGQRAYVDLGDDIAPGVVFPEDDLWREIRAGFALERYTTEKRVQQELRWLERHPQYLRNLKPRMEKYLAYITGRVEERGLPAELALLPIVESALDPYAFSHGGAAGLWQFIPATGKRFGLQRNWWYDGRRDPVAATEAALDYLEHLNKRFDDWYLALAGYNAGEGNVQRARRRASDGATFWELKLPKETSAYVPRLLALCELISNPGRYGVELPEINTQVPFQIVDTFSQIDLGVVARVSEIDIDTLYLWNPALNQWATPPKGPHHLLVPADPDRDVQSLLAAVPESVRVQWLRIKVSNGDTLSQLARRHRTDVTSLRKANNLRGSQIRAGQTLLIPKSNQALSNPVAARTRGATYIVKSGDSLWTIGRAHNVTTIALMKANHIGPKDYLRSGQKLTIPGRTVAVGQGRGAVIRKVHVKVRSGDSLAKIASKFNVQVTQIAQWNKLDTSKYLQPGQSLLVYVNVSAAQSALD